MAAKIFIDGSAGTTGLRIHERLGQRKDIELITLTEENRKDLNARKEALNSSDISFLCLPDPAAIEAVSLIENENVRVIDTSTAHRTLPGWAYGFPELSEEHRRNIISSKRVAVPGCHAGGFISLVYPLIANGIIAPDTYLTCHSVTGYSGGGKKMIAEYEADDAPEALKAPRQYGLTQQHKHLKEMKAISGLSVEPIFCPIVSSFYSGMCVTVPLFAKDLINGAKVSDIENTYAALYNDSFVRFAGKPDENGFITANGMKMKDSMRIYVEGNEDRILLISRFDNLGKGASGAAVECLNLMLGVDPATGLDL